jgi:hypothetical protein
MGDKAAKTSTDTLPKPGRVNEGWLHVSAVLSGIKVAYLAMFDTLYDVSYIMPVVNSEMGAWS